MGPIGGEELGRDGVGIVLAAPGAERDVDVDAERRAVTG